MKTLNEFINQKMLSEAMSDISSDSIAYSTDIWFREQPELKDEFYSVVDKYNINGKIMSDDEIKKLIDKIDLKAFVDFTLGDAKSNLSTDTIDYVYVFKKILQTAKRK